MDSATFPPKGIHAGKAHDIESMTRLLRHSITAGRTTAWLSAVLAFAAALAPTAAVAQVNLSARASSSTSSLVEEATVLENVTSAFESGARRRMSEAELSGQTLKDAEALVASITDRFVAEARQAVNELKGDGVLEAGEVTGEMDTLRSRYEQRLEQALTAMAAGYPPPPLKDRFDSNVAWLGSLADYTLTVRNGSTDWFAFAGALAAGFLIAWLVSRGLRWVSGRVRVSGRKHSAQMVRALAAPTYLAVVALAFKVGFSWLWIPGLAGDFIDRAVQIALVGALFWFVWNACHTVAEGLAWVLRKTYDKDLDAHVVLVVSRVLRIAALGIFTLIVVNHVLDSNLTGLVAGLGIVGLALSFILRGTIENIAASFTILGDKPFRVGDLIVHDGRWGRVEDIGFRSTRFRTLRGHLITIPNARLVDNDIHNAGARPSIRRRFRIGLPYTLPVDKVEEAIDIVKSLLDGHRGQPDDQPPHVALEGYGSHDLTLLVQYHYEPAEYWEALAFDTEFNLALMRRFADAGIEFAFPTQRLFLENGDDGFALFDAGNDAASDDDESERRKYTKRQSANGGVAPAEASASAEPA